MLTFSSWCENTNDSPLQPISLNVYSLMLKVATVLIISEGKQLSTSWLPNWDTSFKFCEEINLKPSVFIPLLREIHLDLIHWYQALVDHATTPSWGHIQHNPYSKVHGNIWEPRWAPCWPRKTCYLGNTVFPAGSAPNLYQAGTFLDVSGFQGE